jgi:hypothetical protein
MPGPFPGMDPYLENPILWPDVHNRLITYLADELNTAIGPEYVATINERVYVVEPPRLVYPDVAIRRTPPVRTGNTVTAGTGATSTAVLPDPPLIITVDPAEVHEPFIVIQTADRSSRVVTIIEVLSPANKASGGPGQAAYLTKQAQTLDSQAHLLEIDLLRGGAHTVAVPTDRITAEGPFDYIVCLHRAGTGAVYETWPRLVSSPLPRIAVPLSGVDKDIIVDLQRVFDRCYEAGAFRLRVDYGSGCVPSLPAVTAAWARNLLEQKGIL